MISTNIINWAEKRSIKKEVLEKLKIESGQALYGDRKLESIIFNYYDHENKIVNYKARAISEKTFKQQTGGESVFYNLKDEIKKYL